MKIDKDNWLLEVASLTDEQLKGVCQYLIGNYERRYNETADVSLFVKGRAKRSDLSRYIGVRDGMYVNFSISHEMIVITYQNFISNIKGEKMKIDKDNWRIREDSLSSDQYRALAKYLVKNYTQSTTGAKISAVASGDSMSRWSKWFYISVSNGYYGLKDVDDDSELITYQDFLVHIKGEQMQTDSKQSLVNQLKLAADTVKRLKAITGSDVEIDSDGIVRIEAFNNVFVIDLDKRSEAEINSLLDSIIVLNEWVE